MKKIPITVKLILFCLLLPALNGCVATALVGGAAATGSAIYDERSVQKHADDIALTSRLEARLIAEKDMPSRFLNIEIFNAEVILTGYLPSQDHIDRAIYICKNFEGVRAVRSKVQIGQPPLKEVVSDSLVTTKVKTALLKDPMVSGFAIHVETVKGRVYLQGLVKELEHKYRARSVARKVDGVQEVIDLLRVSQ